MNTINSFVSEHYEQASAAFLADLKVSSKSKATYNQYAQVLGVFGEWLSEKMATPEQNSSANTQLTPLVISEYKQALAARGIKTNTILHYLIELRSFFKWAIENGLYAEQPVTKSLLPSAEQIKHDIPTIDEINLLLSDKQPRYARHSTAQRNKAIIILFILSGIRVSELCNLRVKDLDFENGTVDINNGKGNKARSAPMPPLAQKALKDYFAKRRREHKPVLAALSPSAYVFVGDDENKTLTRQAVTKLVSGYVRRLTGHKGIGAHDLRHAAASVWDDKGANIREVQKALGHSNVETTERVYVQILDRKKAASNISKLFS